MSARTRTTAGRGAVVLRRGARRPPAGLIPLLAVSLILGVAWTLLTPAFQAPDEQSHFAYAQYFAETGKLPGDPAKPIYSSGHIRGANAVNADQVAGQPEVKPEWSDRLYDAWLPGVPKDRGGDGGGTHSASAYPPAAYAWQAGFYRLAGRDLFDQLGATRLASVLWLPVTVLATWLLAGELTGGRRRFQVAAAAVPALLPMVAFISASTSPDGMLYALWSLTLWLGVRILRRGPSAPSMLALAGLVALACVTKSTSYALLPPLALVLVAALVRSRGGANAARIVAAACVPLLVIVGGWVLLAHALHRPAAAQVSGAVVGSSATDWGGLLSYLWHYYVPRLPGQDAYPFLQRGYQPFQVWIKQGWAAFGWLEVRFPVDVYRLLALVTAGTAVAALVALWRARRSVDWIVAAFLALTVVCLLAGLHWTDYRMLTGGAAFMQGRYLFPVVSLAGLALAAAISLFPPAWRRHALGLALAALFAFHLAAMGLVLERFYA